MSGIINWFSVPEHSFWCFIILALVVIALAATNLILYSRNRRKQHFKPTTTVSLVGVYFVIIILSLFALFALFLVDKRYDNYMNMLAQSPRSDPVEVSILDMQANTLTISTLVVTIAGIVLTVLTIYKERKAEISKRALDESLTKMEQAEDAIKSLSNIVSLTFVGEKQRECYFDALNQIIERNNSRESSFYNHFRIAQISLINNLIDGREDEIALTDKYDEIIKIAEQIIKSEDVSDLDSQFAYLEALHALYLKIKNSVQYNTGTEKEDISKAFKYLKKVEGILDKDSYGHVANLTSLTHLWSGISSVRNGEALEGEDHLHQALQKNKEAIQQNPTKIEFYNHKAVILQQLYDLEGTHELHDELVKTYDYILLTTDRYYKTNVNHAGTIIRDVKLVLGMEMLDQYPDFRSHKRIDGIDYDNCLKELKRARDELERTVKLAPNFINTYYKIGEAITVQLAIQDCATDTSLKENVDDLIKRAKECFGKAESISDKSRPCKLCEAAFHRVIGEEQIADDLVEQCKKMKQK